MTNNRLSCFELEHLNNLPVSDMATRYHALMQEDEKAVELSYTVMQGNKAVASGGVKTLIPGVGECWMVAGDIGPVALARAVKKRIKNYFRQYHRLQLLVKEGDARALRFALWLGFRPEGMQKAYDLDFNSYYRMALIRDDARNFSNGRR